jgi:hypothetical protein
MNTIVEVRSAEWLSSVEVKLARVEYRMTTGDGDDKGDNAEAYGSCKKEIRRDHCADVEKNEN